MYKKAIIAALIIGLCTFALVLNEVTSIPHMASPVVVVAGTIALDGGTRSVEIQDANGERLVVGTRAISGAIKSQFPLNVTYYPKIYPIPFTPTMGGNYEKEFIKRLEKWSSETSCEGFKQAYKRIGQKDALYTCKKIGDLYPIYCILRSRNST